MTIIDMLNNSAAKYGVPTNLVMAVANQESGLNPNAISSTGATGVMQLMPSTASWLGVKDINDPAQNIDAGVKYLAQLYKQYGDWSLALAGYNAGPGNVNKYGGIPPFQETQDYVTKVLTSAGLYGSTDTGSSDTGNVDNSTNSLSWVAGLGIGILILIGLKKLA